MSCVVRVVLAANERNLRVVGDLAAVLANAGLAVVHRNVDGLCFDLFPPLEGKNHPEYSHGWAVTVARDFQNRGFYANVAVERTAREIPNG